jgi:hypothetical protein
MNNDHRTPGTEAQFSSDVVQFFRKMLVTTRFREIWVKEREKTLRDFTIGLDPDSPWAWFVQATHKVSRHDFEVLTRKRGPGKNPAPHTPTRRKE